MSQKYFIAIVPPEPLLADIQNIKQSVFDNYKSKGALRSPGHITLHMPFSFDESKENKLIECLSDFKFKTQLFEQMIVKTGCRHFIMYDDRKDHLPHFEEWAQKQSCAVTVVDVVNKTLKTF